jgi:xylose isomerase
MKTGSDIKFAGRLNAFKIGAEAYWPGKNKITTIDLLTRAATAGPQRC